VVAGSWESRSAHRTHERFEYFCLQNFLRLFACLVGNVALNHSRFLCFLRFLLCWESLTEDNEGNEDWKHFIDDRSLIASIWPPSVSSVQSVVVCSLYSCLFVSIRGYLSRKKVKILIDLFCENHDNSRFVTKIPYENKQNKNVLLCVYAD
jgi:hypothetical protein